VHHNLWDFDIPVGPTLVSWPDGHGGHIPALVSTTKQGSIMYPAFDGVTDWYGASYNPNGTMNIVTNYLPFYGTLIPRKHALHPPGIKKWNGKWPVPQGYGGGTWKPQYGLPYAIHLRPFLSPIQMPCNAPPWAALKQIDLASGKVLWSTYLPAGGQANPAIYKVNGREYVVITAGGHEPLGTKRGDYTVAFVLPKQAIKQGAASQ
jgi:glucose dehydrogenase